jgi:penicillin-binding protein 2
MVGVSVCALTFALVKIQLFSSTAYSLLALENRTRAVVVPAPRGTIYDRHGRVVAENLVGYRILLMPAPMDSLVAVVNRLRPILGLSDEEVQRAFRKYRREPQFPMVVRQDAPPGAVARLQERRFLFPGLLVDEYPKRHYPAGDAIAHLMGYVNEISESELELPEFEGYRQGRWIGKAGLERSYERVLGGQPGLRYLEVDAAGRIKRWLPESVGVPPIPGRDLRLFLDLDLQRYVQVLFHDLEANGHMKEVRGSFVAIDPYTGGILALYATPNFDPNLFVGGIEAGSWARLIEDERDPLLDRAIGSAQPPGSTFKLATAAMAMRLGLLRPEDRMPVPCFGGLRYEGRYARCWYGKGHGSLDLVGAIKNSCNVYFYQVGIRIGLDRFMEEGTRMGFGKLTGVDLPSELPSVFPRDAAWWAKRFGAPPRDNEVMSLSIGQSTVNMTPLRLAELYTALARLDGKAPVPRMVQSDEPPVIGIDLGIGAEQIRALRRGFRRVVGPGGTAALSRLPGWDFLGKTGTAQNPHGDDHAWFVGVGGPFSAEPEIVAVMLLEHGEHGYVASGVVANAVNFYLDRRHGRPFNRFPTPRERIPRGMVIDWKWYMSEVVDPPDPPATPTRR